MGNSNRMEIEKNWTTKLQTPKYIKLFNDFLDKL